jgi:hypothetical protein
LKHKIGPECEFGAQKQQKSIDLDRFITDMPIDN